MPIWIVRVLSFASISTSGPRQKAERAHLTISDLWLRLVCPFPHIGSWRCCSGCNVRETERSKLALVWLTFPRKCPMLAVACLSLIRFSSFSCVIFGSSPATRIMHYPRIALPRGHLLAIIQGNRTWDRGAAASHEGSSRRCHWTRGASAILHVCYSVRVPAL